MYHLLIMYGKAPAKLNFMTSNSPAADTSEGPLPGGHWRFRDEDQKAVSQFRAGDGAMIFMVLATVAHANQIGVVNFANGSTHLTKILRFLLHYAKTATQSPARWFFCAQGQARSVPPRSISCCRAKGPRRPAMRLQRLARPAKRPFPTLWGSCIAELTLPTTP